MNDEQKKVLLSVAADTVAAVVKGQKPGAVSSEDSELNRRCGCFVTLKTGGQLRGCIGQFTSDGPLIELIRDVAIQSATADPRFADNRISEAELGKLDIEISVLSELKLADDPLSLRLGVDGIYIKSGSGSGCFLPQVATEAGWTKEEFLSYCCSHKAGLEPDAWKDGETEVYLFDTEIFGSEFNNIG